MLTQCMDVNRSCKRNQSEYGGTYLSTSYSKVSTVHECDDAKSLSAETLRLTPEFSLIDSQRSPSG